MEFDGLPVCQQKWVYSFFFLQVPKTATTSISSICGERNLVEKHRRLVQDRFGKHPLYRGVFDVRHCLPEHLFSIFKGQVWEFLSFCVVRNPIQRLISSYYFGREKKLHKVYGLPESTTLDEYVRWLYNNKKRRDILILLPQVTWAKNSIFPVEILRFENLQQSWADFLQKYKIQGLPAEIPWENKTKDKQKLELTGESLKMTLDFTFEDHILYPELYD